MKTSGVFFLIRWITRLQMKVKSVLEGGQPLKGIMHSRIGVL